MFRFDLVEVSGSDLRKLFSFEAEWQSAYLAFPGIAREYLRLSAEKHPELSLQCFIGLVEDGGDDGTYPVHRLVWTATRPLEDGPTKVLIRPGPIMLMAMNKTCR
jgi:hypothetical protein